MIELLTHDAAGEPVAGREYAGKFPCVTYFEHGHWHVATLHTFSERCKGDTLGEQATFYVPGYLLVDGQPTIFACDLAARKMGWGPG